MISRIFFRARELSSMFFEPRMAALRPSLTEVILLMSSLRKSVAVFQSLDEYRLPENEATRYKQIKDAAAKLDWTTINHLLNDAAYM